MDREGNKQDSRRPVSLTVLVSRSLCARAARECARSLELCSDAEEVSLRSQAVLEALRVVKVGKRPER